MPVVSSLFLTIALVLAVVIGPQTRPWAWGPAMLALGVSAAAALPEFWRKTKYVADFWLLAFAAIVVGWFAWRACNSPVAQLGEADLMLLSGGVGAFISIRAIEGNKIAERILLWGIALLLIANVFVIGKQVAVPSYSPFFKARAGAFPSGFYAHYNEAANYLIASSLIIASAGLLGRHHLITRIVWGGIAFAGLAAVYFTHSRGGILGAAIGFGVFVIGVLIVGKRKKTAWFLPALMGAPLIAIAAGAFLFSGWESSQKIRDAGTSVEEIFDSGPRLHFLGIAVSTIGMHPWIGGGSRSYSWECFQFLEVTAQGVSVTTKPEQVHNELVQAATDYGIIGAGILAGLLGSLTVLAFVRILFQQEANELDSASAWRLGGMAALAGMFVQSCFSFVFHLLPGVILLGICLGKMACSRGGKANRYQEIGSKFILSIAGVASLLLLCSNGWKYTQVTRSLWASHLSKFEISSRESKLLALTEAISIWPQYSLYQERAAILGELIAANKGPEAQTALQSAIKDYQNASALHSNDAGIAINLANLLSQAQRDLEAEKSYEHATRLQGGMELAFQAHYLFAKHLVSKAARDFNPSDPTSSLESLETAARQTELSNKKTHPHNQNVWGLRPVVYENLGISREANGKYQEALESYEVAAALPGGATAHYRAGYLLSKMGESAWRGLRPSEALAKFTEAKKRVGQAQQLPDGVTAAQRLELIAHIDRWIGFFKEMNVE